MEIVFICKKCGLELTVDVSKLLHLSEYNCPECGEEPDKNWIFKDVLLNGDVILNE